MPTGKPKPRWLLLRAKDGEQVETALQSEAPADAVSDIYILGGMKVAKRMSSYKDPEPGEVVFDTTKGVVHLHDGVAVASGKPSYQCPDCSGQLMLVRKFFKYGSKASPWIYICENKDDGCGAMSAAKVDGSMLAPPADAATRRARKLTTEMFERLWKNAPELVSSVEQGEKEENKVKNAVKARTYRWLAQAMKLEGVDNGHIPSMSIPELRIAYRLCRDADPLQVAASR